ncbi:MAG: hypothetical protein ACYC1D_19590, partial [Acidimicrobiales bacterium]
MPDTVALHSLRPTRLLAEGGEGRVYALADRPELVFKSYRAPVDREHLDRLIAWREQLGAEDPERAAIVEAATAWPTAVVVDPEGAPGTAVGFLLARAPRRFTLRHRDGSVHLATLSYLSADPGQRAAAYGLTLPGPLSAERFGLLHALARLLEVFESAAPSLSHGDLSSKNVLWSWQRRPEVFLLDCDNAALAGEHARVGDGARRRRAMTPNWDDPAVPAGENPTQWSDRYSLALIFLRVCGAAHFPIQARQKQGEAVALDVSVPAQLRQVQSLGEGAPIWALCQRGLTITSPGQRPPAGAWVAALAQVLEELGQARWGQEGAPSGPAARTLALGQSDAADAADVIVRPVPAGVGPLPGSRAARPAPAPAGPRY